MAYAVCISTVFVLLALFIIIRAIVCDNPRTLIVTDADSLDIAVFKAKMIGCGSFYIVPEFQHDKTEIFLKNTNIH